MDKSSPTCRKKRKRGRDQMMEHSETAPPTCYRIFYYYGDFSVAPSFCTNSKAERIERNRAEGQKFNSSLEEKTV